MTSKINPNTLVRNLDYMSAEELSHLSARIQDLIESKKMTEAVGADTLAPTRSARGRKTLNRQASAEWFETKTIHGHQYRYRRWWENGKKRSEYVGKA